MLLDLRSLLEAAAAGNSLAVSITQAAAGVSGQISEDFVFTGAISQPAASISASLGEDVTLAVSITQAASAISASVREDFILAAASTQSVASVSGSLSEDFVLAGAVSQAPASISGTLSQGVFVLTGAITQQAASISADMHQEGGEVLLPASAARITGLAMLRPKRVVKRIHQTEISVTQPPAKIAARLEMSENDDWLLDDVFLEAA